MKISIITIGMALTLLSCNIDDFYPESGVEKYGVSATIHADPRYNSAGRIYREALYQYRGSKFPLSNRASLSEEILDIMLSLGTRPNHSMLGMGELGYKDRNDLEGILQSSWLGEPAKEGLRELVGEVPQLQRQNREAVFLYVDTYQKEVANSGIFSEAEKEVILTAASLFLYANEDPDDRPDKDWEISVGNMARVVEGALQDPDTAISLLLLERLSTP